MGGGRWKQRSAALKIDWARLTAQLGLKGSTVASLQAFKKRNEDVRRRHTLLSQAAQTVDFGHYRQVLGNTGIVDKLEAEFMKFKPVTYDVSRELAAIDKFELAAVKNAEATKACVDQELQALTDTLENITTTRPFEELTIVCFSPLSLSLFFFILSAFAFFFFWRLKGTSTEKERGI